MKKVLIYENRKSSPEIWDVSSSELERGAFLDLFKCLNEDWEVYTDLIDLEPPPQPSLTLEQLANCQTAQ